MFVPVHTTTTRTVEVPVDYGPMPSGWEKLTENQKRWALRCAKDNRWPVWSVLDLGVPSDKDVLRQWADENAADALVARGFIIAGARVAAFVAWLIFKPDCAWPMWFDMYPETYMCLRAGR